MNGIDGRLLHGVGHHVDHAGGPGSAAEILGDGDEAVLGVLAGAEKAGRAEFAGHEIEVGRNGTIDVCVADFVAKHLHHAAVIERRIGEARRDDQVRVKIGAGVVGRV